MERAQRFSSARREVLKAATVCSIGILADVCVGASAPIVDVSRPNRRAIPSTREELPIVGIGGSYLGETYPRPLWSRLIILQRVIDLGGSVIDTAPIYKHSEELIGRFLYGQKDRRKIFLATKVRGGDIVQAEESLRSSMTLLGADCIDLMQVHYMDGTETLLPLFEDWKRAGRIRYIGATTSHRIKRDELVACMRGGKLDFIQVDYSIANRRAADRILPLAKDLGIAVLVNQPFGGTIESRGVFAKVAGRQLPPWAQEIDVKSWPQFFLKYSVSHPAVTCAIPGSTKLEHVEDNMGAAYGRIPDASFRRRMEHFWDSL